MNINLKKYSNQCKFNKIEKRMHKINKDIDITVMLYEI